MLKIKSKYVLIKLFSILSGSFIISIKGIIDAIPKSVVNELINKNPKTINKKFLFSCKIFKYLYYCKKDL